MPITSIFLHENYQGSPMLILLNMLSVLHGYVIGLLDFLVATKPLYMSVCPSVGYSVGPSVGRSVTLSLLGLIGATNAVYTALF